MMTTDFNALTPKLIQLTTEVGAQITRLYKNKIDVEIKTDQTPLTIADKIAHRLIVEYLNKLTPNIPILSEESKYIPFTQRSKWDEYWLIDPLDGTLDFLQHTGEFCICIAYIKHHIPIYGIIYAPLEKTHYYATKGEDAFKLQHNTQQPLKTNTQNRHPFRVVIGHHSSHNKQLESHLKQLKEKRAYNILQLGSALKFCVIAEGLFDYYPRFGPCSEWDTAAGVCILQSAGGQVLDQYGAELRYNTKDDLTSPIFFASGDTNPIKPSSPNPAN